MSIEDYEKRERKALADLFKHLQLPKYKFTPIGSKFKVDGKLLSGLTTIVFEGKVRDNFSSGFTDAIIEKSKLDSLTNYYMGYNIIPYYINVFYDWTFLWDLTEICNINKYGYLSFDTLYASKGTYTNDYTDKQVYHLHYATAKRIDTKVFFNYRQYL